MVPRANVSSLVLGTSEEPRKEPPVSLESCTLCGGPPRLCGSFNRCSGGGSTPLDLRWLTGIRAVYGCLLLTGTPGAVWGGSLLRMGRLVTRGTTPPAGIIELAAEHASHGADAGAFPASLALAYLEHEDLDRLWDLRELLDEVSRNGRLAPWLDDLWVGVRAAVATPLTPKAFSLFAVRCEGCWRDAESGARPALYRHVDTYDQAIRCPGCGDIPKHPLPGVKIGEPHPVGRCIGGAWGARTACMSHEGYELDREGLCMEGRAVMAQAVTLAAQMVGGKVSYDQALVDAVVKAQGIRQRAEGAARIEALGHQMEQLVQATEANGATSSVDAFLTAFEEGVTTVVGGAFLGEVLGTVLEGLGLKKQLKKKRKPKGKKAKKQDAKGAT
jgi:hypothetical protein